MEIFPQSTAIQLLDGAEVKFKETCSQRQRRMKKIIYNIVQYMVKEEGKVLQRKEISKMIPKWLIYVDECDIPQRGLQRSALFNYPPT